jgi:PEP-CTERM motif
MKSKRTNVLAMASLVMCLLALVTSAARGDGGGVDLTLSSVSGASGSEVTVYGTITNTGADDVYLNSENFTLGSTYFSNADVTDFFLNAPLSLGPDSNSGLIALFTFDIASETPAGAYGGNFLDILGGPGDSDQNDLASAEFSVVVANAAVPEPGMIGLIALGLASVILLRRRPINGVVR